MDIYVVYTECCAHPPQMHSVHTTRVLAELARLMIIRQEEEYWKECGENAPHETSVVTIHKEKLISSYEDLGQMFNQRYEWEGEE